MFDFLISRALHWKELVHNDSLCQENKSLPSLIVINKEWMKSFVFDHRILVSSAGVGLILAYHEMKSDRGQELMKWIKDSIGGKYVSLKKIIFHQFGVWRIEKLYGWTLDHPELYLYLDLFCFGLSFMYWNIFHRTLYNIIHCNHVSRYHSHNNNDSNDIYDNLMDSKWKLAWRFVSLLGFSFGYWVFAVPYFRDKLTNPHLCLNQIVCGLGKDAINLEKSYWKPVVYDILLEEFNGTQELANLTLMYAGESTMNEKFEHKIETTYIWDAENDNQINNPTFKRIQTQHSKKLKYIIQRWKNVRVTFFVGLTLYSTFQFIILVNKVIKCELKDQKQYYNEISSFHEKSDIELYGKPYLQQIKEDGFWFNFFYQSIYQKIIRNENHRQLIDDTVSRYIYFPLNYLITKCKEIYLSSAYWVVNKLESSKVTSWIVTSSRKGYSIVTYIPSKMKQHRENMINDEAYKMRTRHRAWTFLSMSGWTFITFLVYAILNDEVRMRV